MDSTGSSHWWLGRFAARLLQTRPHLKTTYAVQCAVANFHQAGHLNPDEAADIVARHIAGASTAGALLAMRGREHRSGSYAARLSK